MHTIEHLRMYPPLSHLSPTSRHIALAIRVLSRTYGQYLAILGQHPRHSSQCLHITTPEDEIFDCLL